MIPTLTLMVGSYIVLRCAAVLFGESRRENRSMTMVILAICVGFIALVGMADTYQQGTQAAQSFQQFQPSLGR